MSDRARQLLRDARRALDVRRLAFNLHDASFPAGNGDGEGDLDPGRGSPYGESALSLLRFASEQGFDVLQLGPQGELTEGNDAGRRAPVPDAFRAGVG